MKANKERASRCKAALKTYDDDLPTALVDFLADARHWCDLNGQSFWELDRWAHRHYVAETNPNERTKP